MQLRENTEKGQPKITTKLIIITKNTNTTHTSLGPAHLVKEPGLIPANSRRPLPQGDSKAYLFIYIIIKWENNINHDLMEVDYTGDDWKTLAQYRDVWRAMNLRVR